MPSFASDDMLYDIKCDRHVRKTASKYEYIACLTLEFHILKMNNQQTAQTSFCEEHVQFECLDFCRFSDPSVTANWQYCNIKTTATAVAARGLVRGWELGRPRLSVGMLCRCPSWIWRRTSSATDLMRYLRSPGSGWRAEKECCCSSSVSESRSVMLQITRKMMASD